MQRLFKYISGANEDEQKIEMTAPVVTRVIAGDGPFCKSLFSVHFFVPFKWQVWLVPGFLNVPLSHYANLHVRLLLSYAGQPTGAFQP